MLEEKQDHTVFSNIMQCSWTECLSIWSTFWIIQPFPICRVYICAIFPNSEGSCPIPKTLLWNASVRFRLFCALCWKYCLKKKKKKKTVGVTRNDPFGYSNTSNIFCLISKYLLLASQTNINIILQDFLYSFGWRRHWSQWKGVVFKIKSYFSKKYNLSKLIGKSCSSFICSLKTSISFPIHSIFINVCKVALLLWFIVAKDCGFDFNVRNMNIKLLYTATLYQVKSYLHIKQIKTPSHLDWGQLRVMENSSVLT